MKSRKSFNHIRTGVIGTGSMGQNHARIYSEISNLVAVADPNEKQGRKVADSFDVIWYSDYRKMLSEVDAVTIAVPTTLHRKVAEVVAAAGVHLLVEKPLADNALDAEAIIKSAATSGVTLAVGHIERHNPIVAHARETLLSGVWGKLITLSSKRLSRYPQRINDVGVILDLAIHDIDVMRYITGEEIRRVRSTKGSMENPNFEDHAAVLIEFNNQIKGICEVSWITPLKLRQLSLTCTKAYIAIDYASQSLIESSSKYTMVDEKNLYLTEQEIESKKITVPNEEPLRRELIDFLQSINSKREPLVTGADGKIAVEVAEKAILEHCF